MKKTKFYICSHCRNTVEMVYDTDIKLVCCGDEMEEMIPNTAEASGEKHLPAVTVKDGVVEVQVGSAEHPMESVHWIEWIQLETEQGSQRKYLEPGQAPRVRFLLEEDKPLAVYAYCNLHGLWKTEL